MERQIIRGQPPSKSNCYRSSKYGGIYKPKTLEKYEEDFYLQCSLRHMCISKRFRLDIDVYFASDRPDLDNSLKVVLDCLQQCEAIKNDRLCAEIHARKLIDKKDPRIEFTITQLI